eukprot:283970_1
MRLHCVRGWRLFLLFLAAIILIYLFDFKIMVHDEFLTTLFENELTILFENEPTTLFENETTTLNFIHIPKTAGTFIQTIAEKSGIEWAMVWFNKRKHLYNWSEIIDSKYKYEKICYEFYHLPPRTFNQVINASYGFDYYDRSKYSSFCVVRDPYRRIFSEYLWNIWWNKYDHMDINESVSHDYLNKHGHSIDHYCNVDIMNGIINEWLRSAINEKKKKKKKK